MTTTIDAPTYKFSELCKDAKRSAINNFSDINVDYDWWEFAYEDANAIGLVIEEFNLDYGTIKGSLQESVYNICRKLMETHGETCDTYKLAAEYMPQFVAARLRGWDPDTQEVADFLVDRKQIEEGHEDDAMVWYEDEFVPEFKRRLEKTYLKWLADEYDYRTSDKAIIESIKANEYEFTEEGEQV